MTKQQINWREKLTTLFDDENIVKLSVGLFKSDVQINTVAIADFISSLLISHLSEVKEAVEGMKKEEFDFELPEDMEFGRERVMDMRSGHNEAIDLVSHLLSEKISKIK